MPKFSEFSKKNLATCDKKLQRVFNKVIKRLDCRILEGRRGEERQNQLADLGLSCVRFPNGRHNTIPSSAVDAGPYPIRWPKKLTKREIALVKEWARWYRFAGFVEGVAFEMGIDLRQGIDWDGDGKLTDQSFDDLPHTELRRKKCPTKK